MKVRTVDVKPLDDGEKETTTLPPTFSPDNGSTDTNVEPLEPHDTVDVGNVDIDELTKLDAGSPEELDAETANEIVRQNADAEVLRK